MASFSGEIKNTYVDVGAEVKIFRNDGDISGEYILSEISTQVTKPFIKEFFREFFTPYDTQIQEGDIIQTIKTADSFLVMNLDAEVFEDMIYERTGVLYKTNVSGQIFRLSGEEWNTDTYQKTLTWVTVKDNSNKLLLLNSTRFFYYSFSCQTNWRVFFRYKNFSSHHQ